MYTIVRITNFGPKRKSWIVKGILEGERILQKDWEDFYNEEITEYGDDVDEELTFHEPDYAILSWENGDRVEWFLTEAEGV